MRCALINMPSALAITPSAALGALKSRLARSEHDCEDIYANVLYAQHVGFDNYHRLFNDYDLLAGNFLFSEQANIRPISRPDYYAALMKREGVESDHVTALIEDLEAVCRLSETFFSRLEELYTWADFDIFAFSSTFQQQAATIGFIKRLKRKFPATPIVCGGANFHADMGVAWLEALPEIDFVCTGEGEETLPRLLDALEQHADIASVPNLARRTPTGIVRSPESRVNLAESGIPDYSGFYKVAATTGIDRHWLWRFHRIPLETSRGCWWGAKQHCVFCGLNGANMEYSNQDDRGAIQLIEGVVSSYNVRRLQFVDNIMPRSYIRTVFPELHSRGLNLDIFYEVKGNMTVDEIRGLFLGGVTGIQPGIESFSARLLKIVKKGISGLQNVYLLKWARYFGIEVSWNLLWGIPGERDVDYDEQDIIIDAISHLEPPSSMPEIRVQRFSPMQMQPETFGISKISAARTFANIFPDYKQWHDRLTYFFDVEENLGISVSRAKKTYERVQRWRERFGCGASLTYARLPGKRIVVEDRRDPTMLASDVFLYPASLLYELTCLDIVSPGRLSEQLAHSGTNLRVDVVTNLLRGFCARSLMIEEDGLFFGVAIPASTDLMLEDLAAFKVKLLKYYNVQSELDNLFLAKDTRAMSGVG
ncbi:RiPP maturation radical SAM C-methyltransferase [Bradyrhizobium sp. CCGE-LA001]|uniref:RiPP maturation radical SAM C-methyltransferase n=1 Tax=Bradyrhizobium sp. CCGE-LA001 TaxID=1223566 RepID=UPI000745DEE0|nr:RiPP maturation radical SAM C-methyltransferase [Bradyrhizobium sp. CCGE-LA001]AMA55723.1 hypothetical protein BCCGELA001_05205 [Bradyrhizobium sp. CCGE-LA001]